MRPTKANESNRGRRPGSWKSSWDIASPSHHIPRGTSREGSRACGEPMARAKPRGGCESVGVSSSSSAGWAPSLSPRREGRPGRASSCWATAGGPRLSGPGGAVAGHPGRRRRLRRGRGDGVARQLALAGVPLSRISAIFITHHHSDHNAGYGNLLLLGWVAGLKPIVDAYGPAPARPHDRPRRGDEPLRHRDPHPRRRARALRAS